MPPWWRRTPYLLAGLGALTLASVVAFGTLFGFLGIFIALPAAAVTGVLVRFGLKRYLASSLYDPAETKRDRGS